MKKTLDRDSGGNFVTVNADTLAAMLDCGRATAVKVGVDAGAKIQVGRRTLYKIDLINRYLDGMAGI
ncbi:MAG: hypothetical protein LIO81_07870 [Clostridiales bacterium]|nr:hypothetical protein [Clostridiales bacterium]